MNLPFTFAVDHNLETLGLESEEGSTESVIIESLAELSPELIELILKSIQQGIAVSGPVNWKDPRSPAGSRLNARCLPLKDRNVVIVTLLSCESNAEGVDMQTAFLSNMNHEIRTPLNGLVGMIDLLEGTKLDDDQREMMGIIRTSSDTLMKLIDDVLTYSRLEAGRVDLEAIPFSPNDCINSCLRLQKEKGLKPNLTMESYIDPSVPSILIGDGQKLQRILLNLISNAAKFTFNGSIELFASAQPINPKSIALTLDVKDTGIGIPPDMRDLLFLPFSQAEASRTRRFSGSGLGLAISQRLVELMGGAISVKSEEGIGSQFTLTIPFGLMDESNERLSNSQRLESTSDLIDENRSEPR